MKTRKFRRLSRLVCAGILAAALPGQAQPPLRPLPSVEPFQRWSRAAAQELKGDLCRFGTFQFDPQQPQGLFAVFRRPVGKDQQFILITAWGDRRKAFMTEPAFVTPMDCPTSPRWESGKEVRLGPWGPEKDYATFTVVDNDLKLLAESSEGSSITGGLHWDHLTEGFTNDEDPSDSSGRAILLVLAPQSPWRSRLPPPRNWVTFGQAAHTGPADAEIDARVDLSSTDQVLRIRLSAKDDVARPLPSARAPDAAFIKADHFELWFCAGGSRQSCEKKATRQLGVARLANGKLHARWLHPRGSKEPLPIVTDDRTSGGSAIVVTIPLRQIQHDEGLDVELEGKLTAVYSDSDGGGQESVVATSQLSWGDPDSFGRIVRLPQGARFPAFTAGAGFEETPAIPQGLRPPP